MFATVAVGGRVLDGSFSIRLHPAMHGSLPRKHARGLSHWQNLREGRANDVTCQDHLGEPVWIFVFPLRDGIPPYRMGSKKQLQREMHRSVKANGQVSLPHFPVSIDDKQDTGCEALNQNRSWEVGAVPEICWSGRDQKEWPD